MIIYLTFINQKYYVPLQCRWDNVPKIENKIINIIYNIMIFLFSAASTIGMIIIILEAIISVLKMIDKG